MHKIQFKWFKRIPKVSKGVILKKFVGMMVIALGKIFWNNNLGCDSVVSQNWITHVLNYSKYFGLKLFHIIKLPSNTFYHTLKFIKGIIKISQEELDI